MGSHLCYSTETQNELRDGKVTKGGSFFNQSDEQLWEQVDDIFYKYDINMDEQLDLDEAKEFIKAFTKSSDE